MRAGTWLALVTACSVFAASRTTAAAPTLEAQAADAAFARLTDAVLALEVAPGRTVATLFATAPGAELALREALLDQHIQTQPRSLPGLAVEVDAFLPADRLTSILRSLVGRHFPEADPQHVNVPPHVGPAIGATGRAAPGGPPRSTHPGWRHTDARQTALAARACDIDLQHTLMARIARQRLSAHDTVGHLLREHPPFRDAVRRRIEALTRDEVTFEPTGVCVRSVELSRGELIALLAAAAGDAGDAVDADFSRLMDPGFEEMLVIQAFGAAPPAALIRPALAAKEEARPEWADRFLTARAVGQPPLDLDDRHARRDFAARAARIEARRQILLDIEALTLLDGESIGRLMQRVPAALDALADIDQAIIPMATPITHDDDSVTVHLGIRLESVWRAVQHVATH